jgi:hypothetical protein
VVVVLQAVRKDECAQGTAKCVGPAGAVTDPFEAGKRFRPGGATRAEVE